MDMTPPQIVDTAALRRLSGKRGAAAIRRWASQQGIRCGDGASGPWTTLQAINFALGVPTPPPEEKAYDVTIL